MNVHDATEQAYKNGYKAGQEAKAEETRLRSDGRGIYYDMNGNMMRCQECNEVFFVRSGERFNFCPKCGRRAKR